jgi:hypothetical protein
MRQFFFAVGKPHRPMDAKHTGEKLAAQAAPAMDEIDDIRHRLRVSNLQARQELLEIERTSLLREINSSLTSQDRRTEAITKRDELTTQWAEVVEELQALPLFDV